MCSKTKRQVLSCAVAAIFAALISCEQSDPLVDAALAGPQQETEDPSTIPPQNDETMAPDAFRQVLIKLALVLEAVAGPTDNLPERIAGLSDEEMSYICSVFPNQQAVTESVGQLYAGLDVGEATKPNGADPRHIVGTLEPPFPPAYPDGVAYDIFTLTLDDTGLLTDTDGDGELNNERCIANGGAQMLIALAATKVAAELADAGCQLIVVVAGEGGSVNVVACASALVLREIVAGVEIAISQCTFQDGQVDSAEIEAAYENSVIIVDAVTCRVAQAQRMGHGCNGLDDDCDKMIDECDEDVFGPQIHIDPVVYGMCRPSTADAAEAVLRSVAASDDCSRITVDEPIFSAPECDATVDVTATDECGNPSTASTMVTIDGQAPEVSCSVKTETLFPPNHKMVNVGFTFTAMDNCTAQENLNIEVRVTSDEATASAEGAGQGAPWPDANVLRDIEGNIHGVRLRSEHATPGNGRVYQIHVIATDACGNSGRSSCTVAVAPNGNTVAVDDGQFFDATEAN